MRVRRGQSLNWHFSGADLHNLTLRMALGIASPDLNVNRDFDVRFTRPGTYRFFCALHLSK